MAYLQNADTNAYLEGKFEVKADLVDGKVPAEQLPAMDYAPAAHVDDTVKHITAEERTLWNAKASADHTHDGRYYTETETLANTTKTLFGLGADAVPDDVFRKIPDKVGDIKVTVRTDLGDNWYLCNGAAINPMEHPDWLGVLKDFKGSNSGTFQQITKVFEKYNNFGFASAPYIRGVCRVNGYTFYGISETSGTANTKIFSVSPDDVVTEHVLPTDANSCYPVEGVYKNGQYVLRCFASYTSVSWSRVIVFDAIGGEPRYSWMSAARQLSSNYGGLEIDAATGEVYLFGGNGATVYAYRIDLQSKTDVEVVLTSHGNNSLWCRPVVYNGYMYACIYRGTSYAGHVYSYSLSGDKASASVGPDAIPKNAAFSHLFVLVHGGYLYAYAGDGNCWRYSLETGDTTTFSVSGSITNNPITCVDDNGFFTGNHNWSNHTITAYRWEFEDGEIKAKGSFSANLTEANDEYPSTNRSSNASGTQMTIDENGFYSIDFIGATSNGKHMQLYQTIKLPKLSLDGAYAYIKLEEDKEYK